MNNPPPLDRIVHAQNPREGENDDYARAQARRRSERQTSPPPYPHGDVRASPRTVPELVAEIARRTGGGATARSFARRVPPVLGAIRPHESAPAEEYVRGFPGVMFTTTGRHIRWVGDSKPSDVLVSFND